MAILPFCRTRLRVLILALTSIKKPSCDGSLIWRRERDSNPRYAVSVYTLSRRAPSATRPSLRSLLLHFTLKKPLYFILKALMNFSIIVLPSLAQHQCLLSAPAWTRKAAYSSLCFPVQAFVLRLNAQHSPTRPSLRSLLLHFTLKKPLYFILKALDSCLGHCYYSSGCYATTSSVGFLAVEG